MVYFAVYYAVVADIKLTSSEDDVDVNELQHGNHNTSTSKTNLSYAGMQVRSRD